MITIIFFVLLINIINDIFRLNQLFLKLLNQQIMNALWSGVTTYHYMYIRFNINN